MYEFDLQSAKDIDLPIIQRLANARREPSLLGRAIQPVALGLVRVWLRGVHRLEATGLEHLPAEPPYLLVANHTSHFDTAALMSCLPRNVLHCAFPIAAHDTFFRNPLRSFLAATCVNALPVRRCTADRQALGVIRERLIDARSVMIVYPEGTRGDGQVMRRFMPGVGMLVADSAVPVVPCRLRGCEAALPKGKLLPRPKKISLSLGKPLTFESTTQCRSAWKQIASELQEAVEAL
jgi:1-acyl-sn-glycerol-3-phosphate acyltransferase